MNQPPLEPLVHSVEVTYAAPAAFDTLVFRPGTWWPLKDHSTFGAQAADIIIQSEVGGRIFERNHNSEERD
jgi:hypothetical protein